MMKKVFTCTERTRAVHRSEEASSKHVGDSSVLGMAKGRAAHLDHEG